MRKVGSSTSKIGRNKDACAKYRLNQHREKNRINKWKRSIKNLSDDNAMRVELEKKIRKLEKIII